MSENEMKQLLEQFISEYVLKLSATELALSENREDLRILKKNYLQLEVQLEPSQQRIIELEAQLCADKLKLQDLAEQLNDLNASAAANQVQLKRLHHQNTTKFYALILLLVISLAALSLVFFTRPVVLGQLGKPLAASAKPQASTHVKQKRKRNKVTSSAVDADSANQQTTINASDAI